MIGAVVGNGPSGESYDLSADYVIACNIPSKKYSVDATVIVDEEIVWLLKNNPELIEVPVILSNKAWEKMKELKIDNQFEILDSFRSEEWHNAGHYAAKYLMKNVECDTIQIWGCDSYFEDTIDSTTDELVEKRNDNTFIRHWRGVWNQIIDNNPRISFEIKRNK